ncbi:DUF6049 family protein [Microbacterium atlanticum]|uniref:DUF6049 family protein n=1 Tax=Microbacterium atlanticum TaxID=2782168 RepID=UPI001E64826E|nr:DUF6049 family protein [Microbacterium atlanticum]
MTQPRALRRTPRRAQRLVTAVLAAAAVLAPLVLPAPATAAASAVSAAPAPSPEPTPTPTSGVPAGTTAFTLSPLGNGVVPAGEALSVSISRQNGTGADLAPVDVTLSLGAAPLADRAALTAWLAGEASDPSLQPIATETIGAVAAGSFQVRGLTIPADDPSLAGRAPGVYPLAASFPGETGAETSVSAMVVPPAGAPEVGLGVIVPITAGPLRDGLLTADELAVLTGPDGALTDQLDAVSGTPAILAVDPAIPAAIRVLGTSAPDSAAEWLTRLEGIQNSRFALQFGDADVTAQLQAGLPRPLAPTSFAAYMSPSDFAGLTPSPTPTPTPRPGTPSPTPTAPPGVTLPSTGELLDIGPATRTGVYWPADGTAGADIVSQLGGLPTDAGIPSMTVLPSATIPSGAAGGTVAALGRVGESEVLVYDSDISTALGEATRSEEPWLRGGPLTAATAYLAFAAAEASGPLLVTVGRGDGRSGVELGAAVSAAFTAPGVVPRALPALAAGEPVELSVADVEPSPDGSVAAAALVQDEGELARFATILDQPSLLTGPERNAMLQLLGVAWVGNAQWPGAIAEHRAETRATLGSVSLLPTVPSDLYGSNASLRFWVRNDLPYPVNLVLYTTRDNLRLDVQNETPVVATAQSNTRVEVPVQARVGRGEVTLTLQLRSPAFVAIGEPESVEVNVWADWEAVGIGALAVLVGALLVMGIVRTVLRVRRRRRRADAATPADAPAPGDTAADADADADAADEADADAAPPSEGAQR